MAGTRKKDTLARAIETVLNLGQFISYGQSWDFVNSLERIKGQIDEVLKAGEARRAAGLYEVFLCGCYEKADEIDDSGGNLGEFAQTLVLSWVAARQKAGYPADETVNHLLRLMDNDDYGFCYDIEPAVSLVLNKEHFLLFHKHFADQLETASKPFVDQEPRFIYDYPAEVFMVVSVLKGVYTARKDLKSYLSLCEKTTTSPKDCEQLVGLCKAKKRFVDALAWVEKGLALEKRRQWGNQSSLGLGPMKQELLRKLGRSEEALDAAWSEFKNHPSMYGYEDVMKCVSKADVAQWHRKAMDVARAGPLSGCIEICTRTKEWDMLSERIAAAKHEELEDVSHYYSEGAAKGLAKHHKQAAAKVYRALGMRIVKAGKSKYYQHALAHLQKARKLYEKTGQAEQWQSIVCMIRRDHSRKSSFIGPFEVIAAGGKQDSPASFERIVQKRWKKQTSGAPSKGHGPRIE